ncbi:MULTISPECIES: hypothetical protein [unclassified Ensifer]|uniref:hypothetical protein n=1 Tax=Ensifer TaxID=106591 RepID=UPI00046CFBBD|nr:MULTISPECIES: hypothetical protein [unclassified Ensifer]KQU98427.1 hypothetical protein ASD00_01935 [Ensifer sp. Root31]KQW63186.1 hypothetical protein ASD02_03570 [Ensifer sp. Root1252]KQY75595.1 hypothetical protein ASD52_24015 [Ensifer sp. Root142]KRC84006.1 hypothetical protein ASE32_03560 [Ensifer sp. Root231]KRD04360.1 hypothetical protein ASE47_02220 [Ensifer sp. Root258]
MYDDRKGPLAVRELDDEDMAALLAALAGGSSRVERRQPRDRMVWIKRDRRVGPRLGLLFLQIASRALKPETPDRAFAAWKLAAPAEAAVAPSEIKPLFTRLLPLARFFLRIQNGHDPVRLVAATDSLATQSQS